jgi:hypothetical protein
VPKHSKIRREDYMNECEQISNGHNRIRKAEMTISPKYRATLEDGDTSRERPLTIYGDSMEEIEK